MAPYTQVYQALPTCAVFILRFITFFTLCPASISRCLLFKFRIWFLLRGVMAGRLASESLFFIDIDCMMSVGVGIDIFAISLRTAAQQ